MHPRHKLQYFRDANWDDEWIATATSIIRDEFERAYADLPIKEVEVAATIVRVTCLSLRKLIEYNFFQITTSIKRNVFDDLPSLSAPVTSKLKDELQQYLECPVEDAKDVLLWWIKNRAVYPRLSQMALDYLSIPGMCSNLSP